MSPNNLSQLASGFSELANLTQFLRSEEQPNDGASKIDFRMPESLLMLDQQGIKKQQKQG